MNPQQKQNSSLDLPSEQSPSLKNSSYFDLAVLVSAGFGLAILAHWVMQVGFNDKSIQIDWKPVFGSVPAILGAAKWSFDKLKVVWAVAEKNKNEIIRLDAARSEQQQKLTELHQEVLLLKAQASNLYDRVSNDKEDISLQIRNIYTHLNERDERRNH